MESEVPAARKRVLEDKNQDTWKPLEAWRAPSRAEETTRQRVESTEVKYPLLCACSSSAALTAAGLHTHVRTHRTSNSYISPHVRLFVHEKRRRRMLLFPESGPKKGLSGNGFTKTVTSHLRSIVPNVQRHMAYFASCRAMSGLEFKPSCSLPACAAARGASALGSFKSCRSSR